MELDKKMLENLADVYDVKIINGSKEVIITDRQIKNNKEGNNMFDSVEMYDGTVYYMVEVSDETFKYIPKHGECTTNLWELYGELEDYIVNEIMSTIEYKDYVYDLPTFFLDFCKEASLMQYIEEVEGGYKIKHNIIQHFIFNWEVKL